MRPAPLIASGGLLLLACSCYGPAYQQPYGYPGQVQPGTQYYPGGTTVPGPSLGTPTFDTGQAPISGGGGDAPTFGTSAAANFSTGCGPSIDRISLLLAAFPRRLAY